MRNSKILKVVITSALVASLAATCAMSASAVSEIDEIKDNKVGATGQWLNWGNLNDDGSVKEDIPMTDDDGDGVYEAVIDIPNVDASWITDWNKDDKPTGEKHFQFKVRLNNDWPENWAAYEPEHDRVFDSQCNLAIMEDVQPGDHINFTVFLDTTKNNPDMEAAYDEEEMVGVAPGTPTFETLWAGYKNFEKVTDTAEEPSQSEEPSQADEPSQEDTTPATTGAENNDEPSQEDTTVDSKPAEETDTTTPATGDTTSAVALVAVVLASLGTAVVMTKKASVKD